MRLWSEFEEAILALYAHKKLRAALYAALPHRTRGAIRMRAYDLGFHLKLETLWTDERLADLRRLRKSGKSYTELAAHFETSRPKISVALTRLGLGERNRWTSAEVSLLRREWQEIQPRTLASKLKRHSWMSIIHKAADMKLGPAVPQGFESLNASAIRTNFNPKSLRRLLALQGVVVRHPYGRRCYTASGSNSYYEPDEVDAAIARELRLESLGHAARRHNVDRATLRTRLLASGLIDSSKVRLRASARLDPDVVDRVVKETFERRQSRKAA